MKALQKYPANDAQTWFSENVFLGCHAQWITPESINEQLPFHDYEKGLVITADAIIDNRNELFEKLQVKPGLRKTIPDSQLILMAYEKWGRDTPKYLIGDFAFMIWDEKNQQFFGARDFSGARTLYYFNKNPWFAFCTLIEPLWAIPFVEKTLNEHWLAEFLAIPTMVDAADIFSTVYRNIKQVPPSHSITVSNGKVTLLRYSILPEEKTLKLNSNEEYEEAFSKVFEEAVSSRLRTHSNVGAHLSGGLDSGAVVSFASPMLKREQKSLYTYSYVPVNSFIDWTSKSRLADERPFIQETVQYVGNITDHYLSFEEKNPFSEIDDCLDTMEMPYKFYANSFWLKGIFEKASEHKVGVILNGQRGNTTISWGNALEYQITLLKRLKWIRFYQEVNLYSKNRGVDKSRVLTAIRNKISPFQKNASSQAPVLINPDFAKRTNVFERLEEFGLGQTGPKNWREFRKLHFEQLFNWNINGTYATKLSLRYSLWDRDPTNDLRCVRFCLSIPEEQYVQNGLDRALVRRATKGKLPEKVRLNHRIRGIQGADGVHRMAASWETFINELQQMNNDSSISEYINKGLIETVISRIKDKACPEYVYDMEFSMVMRSLIVYRFMKNHT